MWLLDQMLTWAIRKNRLVITECDGRAYEYGPDPQGLNGRDLGFREAAE